MENASDALRIAFGVLIAVLLISMLVYVFRQMSLAENAQSMKEVTEQTAEFNAKFNAFEKNVMYGTDLISILGLAYSNNVNVNRQKTLNPNGKYDPNLDGSVNIEFKLPVGGDIKTKKNVYTYGIEQDADTGRWLEKQTSSRTEDGRTIFRGGQEYSLATADSTTLENIRNIIIDGKSTLSSQTIRTGSTTKEVIYEDTTGYSDFKQNIFKCVEVKYNQVGRIYYMRFEPADITD